MCNCNKTLVLEFSFCFETDFPTKCQVSVSTVNRTQKLGTVILAIAATSHMTVAVVFLLVKNDSFTPGCSAVSDMVILHGCMVAHVWSRPYSSTC